jgi:cytochrome c oxidase assembly protein subunit 15
MFSKGFVRLNWITLVLIYLVIIAGSVVRISGSGMGCPDWPKCFGTWVPPTSESTLPQDYRTIYGEKRVAKVEKFTNFLSAIGFKESAERIKNDPRTYEEEAFNVRKTWTEYANRWVGFLSGNGVLFILLWTIVRYRSDKRLLFLTVLNLILITLNAWFGSIVVATNLVPWVITVHMFLALALVIGQLLVIRRISPMQQKAYNLAGGMKWLIAIILAITTYQIFLGSQVRESIDALTFKGIGRDAWTDHLGWPFLVHRSFSWLVLVLILMLGYWNHQTDKIRLIYWGVVVLALELIGGVLLSYADMPGFVQVSHLLFATVLFGIFVLLYARLKPLKNVQNSFRMRG